jgi:hypothetical protein
MVKRPRKTRRNIKNKEIWNIVPITHSTPLPAKFNKLLSYKDKTGKTIYLRPNALIFKQSQAGGAGEFPLTHMVVKNGLAFLAKRDPTPISRILGNVRSTIEWPMKTLKANKYIGPFVDVGMASIHGVAESGVSAISGAGATVGGPIGAGLVLPITLGTAAAGSLVAITEGDLGQSTVHILNAIPAVGSSITKGVAKIEQLAKKLDNSREKINAIPLVGEKIADLIPDLDHLSDENNSVTALTATPTVASTPAPVNVSIPPPPPPPPPPTIPAKGGRNITHRYRKRKRYSKRNRYSNRISKEKTSK